MRCIYISFSLCFKYIYTILFSNHVLIGGRGRGFEESFGFDLSTKYFSTTHHIKNLFFATIKNWWKMLLAKINTYQRLFFCIGRVLWVNIVTLFFRTMGNFFFTGSGIIFYQKNPHKKTPKRSFLQRRKWLLHIILWYKIKPHVNYIVIHIFSTFNKKCIITRHIVKFILTRM